MTFFVISVLTFNLILWIVLLIRFKKLFSTDNIIEKTREKLEHLIREIDTAADRDTYLAKETTKRIKEMIDEADLKMELFREATQRLRDMIAEADRINKGHGVAERIAIKQPVDSDAAFEVKIQNKKPEQGNLFEQSNDTYSAAVSKSIQKNETNVTPDGAAYHEIPLIITKVYDDKPAKPTTEEIKKNLPHLVRKKLDEGMTPEEIAVNLNCSITEVQFIIDMCDV